MMQDMKAVVCRAYGPPEVLELLHLHRPDPAANELLVKVMASTVNSGDVRVRGLVVKGFMKFMMRLVLGYRKPRRQVQGIVFSGVVESAGKQVTSFAPGDRVYGMTGFQFGAHAEYLKIKETAMVSHMPAHAGYEEAAALVFGGSTAIHFLQRSGITGRSGAKVLIYGATGSVGSSALQLARMEGAEITAVCSPAGEQLARELGAKHILHYGNADWTKQAEQYDLIFDAVGKISRNQVRHLLSKKGKFLTVGGLDVAKEKKEQLVLLRERFESGQLLPVIDRVYPMEEIREAHRYVDTGRKKGNVVIRIGS